MSDDRAEPVEESERGAAAEPDDTPALLLDDMLGKLGTYLRMCGYDAAYTMSRNVDTDHRIIALAETEGRTILTRDADLAARAPEALLLHSRDTLDQLRELADAGFVLELDDEPVRCGACNAPLQRVAPEEQTPDYAPEPDYEAVWRCRECGQHFWRGSHWENVADTLERL